MFQLSKLVTSDSSNMKEAYATTYVVQEKLQLLNWKAYHIIHLYVNYEILLYIIFTFSTTKEKSAKHFNIWHCHSQLYFPMKMSRKPGSSLQLRYIFLHTTEIERSPNLKPGKPNICKSLILNISLLDVNFVAYVNICGLLRES